MRVLIKPSLLSADSRWLDFDPARRLTVDGLVHAVSTTSRCRDIAVMVDGKELLPGDPARDLELLDGQQVVLAPRTGGVEIGTALVFALISTAISYGVSYAMQALNPRPKPIGVGQERGDQSSQTYDAWGAQTNNGPGQPIPWAIGRNVLAGQIIWNDSEANYNSATQKVDDKLRMILSLCEGPIHRIGDVLAVPSDGLGGFAGVPTGPAIPSGIELQGNLLDHTVAQPGARVWLRPGTQDQPSLPAPFAGVATTIAVQQQLTPNTAFAQTISSTDEISSFRIVFVFPSGLYQSTPTGAVTGLAAFVIIQWRPVGSSTWTLIRPFGSSSYYLGQLPLQALVGYYAATVTVTPDTVQNGWPTGVVGPIEIQITQHQGTLQPGITYVDTCEVRDIVLLQSHVLRYPREALIAIEALANDRFNGTPNMTVIADCAKVRVWDEDDGWSEECWDVPDAPFDFQDYPPGRNPAWGALAFILAPWGMGSWWPANRIDLPAFRRWSANCDRDPNPADPWGEPQYCVDLVGDQPNGSLQNLLTIFAAGRAAPVMVNGLLSVAYQFRDAHGDAGITVPAKSPEQLITGGMVEDVEVTWLSKANRPNVLLFQFLDEEARYTQDVEPVEDDTATFNDPTAIDQDDYRPETVQAFGVTRRAQLWREGKYRHRLSRGVTHQLSFTAPPMSLGLTVGSLFLFQHPILVPWGNDDQPLEAVVTSVSSSTSVEIDHELAGTGLVIIGRGTDGAPTDVIEILSYLNSTDELSAVDPRPRCKLTLANPLDVAVGQPVVVGVADKLTQTYEVASIAEVDTHKVQVVAFNWVPSAHDDLTQQEYLDSTETLGPTEDVVIVPSAGTGNLPQAVLGANLVAIGGGRHRLAIGLPPARGDQTAVVWRRDGAGVWQLLGEAVGGALETTGCVPGETYEFSVCLPNRKGSKVPPEIGTKFSFEVPEFPSWAPPALHGVTAVALQWDLLIEFEALDASDVEAYELRAGSCWAAGVVLDRTRSPRVYVSSPPRGRLMLAARATTGMFGPITVIEDVGWTPPDLIEEFALDEISTTPAGTHSGTVWNATDQLIELDDEVLAGTYTSAVIDLTDQVPRYWQVQIDRLELECSTVDDLTFTPDSGEGMWRLADGRPASAARPGTQWSLAVDDLPMLVDDMPGDLLAQGWLGAIGSHTLVLCETRFKVDGSWGAWDRHHDRKVLASAMQVRLSLFRETTVHRAQVTDLIYRAYL